MLRARYRVRSRSGMSWMRAPSTMTSPDVTSSIPDSVFNSVVFPQPDGPMTATICPRSISNVTPRSASTGTPAVW